MTISRPVRSLGALLFIVLVFLFYQLFRSAPTIPGPGGDGKGEQVVGMKNDPMNDRKLPAPSHILSLEWTLKVV